MLAWWVTWWETSGWPSRWRLMCTTSAPAKVPRVTGTSPKRVATVAGRPSSNPGRA